MTELLTAEEETLRLFAGITGGVSHLCLLALMEGFEGTS